MHNVWNGSKLYSKTTKNKPTKILMPAKKIVALWFNKSEIWRVLNTSKFKISCFMTQSRLQWDQSIWGAAGFHWSNQTKAK